MQTVAIGTRRITVGHIWIAGLALAFAILGATIVSQTISSRSESRSENAPLLAVNNPSTLALDREGADVFALPTTHAADITGLALDRDGADMFVAATTNAPIDMTTLHLDRDGADVVPVPANMALDITSLDLDRDGADLP